jgi:hypothetical protein
MRPTSEPPRDFTDRLMRTLLVRPENLADFLRSARPHLAGGFAFDQVQPSQGFATNHPGR